MDKFGKNACDYYGDVTWGLRDGQLGPTLELLKALLGFKSSPDGTLRLHGNVAISSGALEKCSARSPSRGRRCAFENTYSSVFGVLVCSGKV